MAFKLMDILGGSLFDGVSKIISNFKLSPEKAAEIQASLEENKSVIQQAEIELNKKAEDTLQTEINARKDVMIAEIQSGSNYVRNMRPTIGYTGLIVIVLNHVILPWIAFFTGHEIPKIELPLAFWTAWGGITSLYVIGRTAERRGATGKLIEKLTGNKSIF